nr:hypothetical protein [Tanacetum cinerariifolium]
MIRSFDTPIGTTVAASSSLHRRPMAMQYANTYTHSFNHQQDKHHHRHRDLPLKYLRSIIFFNMLIRSSIISASSGLNSFVKKFAIRSFDTPIGTTVAASSYLHRRPMAMQYANTYTHRRVRGVATLVNRGYLTMWRILHLELGVNSYIRPAGGYVLQTELNEPVSESFAEGDSDQPVYSTKESIRTGILSKRWRHLWPQLPNLVFEYNVNDDDRIFKFYSSVEKMDTLQINAPYIESLTIKGDFDLKAILLLNVSSVIQAQLDYSNTKALYAMEIHEHHQMNEELFKGLILSVSHVKELKVGKSCLEVLASLKSKGFICPSNMNVFEEID